VCACVCVSVCGLALESSISRLIERYQRFRVVQLLSVVLKSWQALSSEQILEVPLHVKPDSYQYLQSCPGKVTTMILFNQVLNTCA
jgi:hypothetical protein